MAEILQSRDEDPKNEREFCLKTVLRCWGQRVRKATVMSSQEMQLLPHPRSAVVGAPAQPPCQRSDRHIAAHSDHKHIEPEIVSFGLLVLAAASRPAPAPDIVVVIGSNDTQPVVVVRMMLGAEGVASGGQPHRVIRADLARVKHETILWECGL
jgi:hypothetical protein